MNIEDEPENALSLSLPELAAEYRDAAEIVGGEDGEQYEQIAEQLFDQVSFREMVSEVEGNIDAIEAVATHFNANICQLCYKARGASPDGARLLARWRAVLDDLERIARNWEMRQSTEYGEDHEHTQ